MSSSFNDAVAASGDPQVHEATRQDRHHLKDVLARSFWDDPVISWLIPNEQKRYARAQLFFRNDLAFASRHGVVLTTEDQAGTALWLSPGRWKMPPIEVARNGPTFVRAFGSRLAVASNFNVLIEKHHPHEQHWYLAVLGTDPTRQGRGVGGALIRHITDRADRDGVGCYLESSKAANVPYYTRFGFKVIDEITAPDGPMLWGMWRDPR